LFKPLSRRSLPQHLAFAVARAVGATVALLVGYVGTAVASDMSHLAEGRRFSDPAPAVVNDDSLVLCGALLEVCLEPADE
jgi:hypothetical protein